mgnify:CR=1 FL=1
MAEFVGDVNLFEGEVTAREPHRLRVATANAGGLVAAQPVVPISESKVAVAIRPEKIELHKKEGDEPPNLGDCPKGFNAVAGVIKHEAYLGGSSTYEVEIAGGRRVKVQRSNLTRWDQEDFKLGETVWLCWHACSPAVLLS